MQTVTKFAEMSRENGYFRIFTDTAEVRVYFMSDDVVRIRASFDKKFREASYLLTETGWDDELDEFMGEERTRIELLQPEVSEDADRIVFSTKTVDLVLNKEPFAFAMYDKNGVQLYSDLAGKAFQLDHLGRIYHYNAMKPDDCFYGFGEKTGEINKNGRYMRFSPKDSLGYNPVSGDPMYKHIPVYIRLDNDTRKAVGLFYHNTYEAAVSMGDEISGYWPRYTYYVADGGDIDYFLINGPEISKIVERYTDLTGKTFLQPKFSLGYLGSTMYYVELPEDCDKEILAFIDKVRDMDIPIDSFMLSSGYTASEKDNKRNFFTWNKRRVPDPQWFFDEMKKRGVEISPNVKPGFLKVHPYYDDVEKKGCFVKTPDGKETQTARWWGGPGAYFDFTNPAAREEWERLVQEYLMKYGARSVWNDNCEFDAIDDREALCEKDGLKGTFGELKSVQPTLMSRSSHVAARKFDPDMRPYVICRSGGAGIQRYAQTWAGDNPTSFLTLKYNIATLLGSGLSGVANTGSDNGGFQGPAPGAELLVRWVQNGIFQPRFSIHSCNTDNTVTEPWMYSDYTHYIRDAIKLRYEMIPYLYSMLYEASTKGDAIMRPVFYDFQNDPKVYREGVNFMFGPYILVANVVEEGATEREVYLPAGTTWYDYYTRKPYEGGQTITIPVDMGSVPMFVREGAIIPQTKGLHSILQEPIKMIKLLITPKTAGHFDMYDDDGMTNNYKKGEKLITHIDVTPGEKVYVDFNKEGNYDSGIETMILDVVNREKGPFWVSVGDDQLKQYLHREKWEAAEEGFYYSHTLKSVLVKYKERKGNYRVTVSFEKFDLIGM